MKNRHFLRSGIVLIMLLVFSIPALAGTGTPPSIGGIRLEFVIFALTLVGVAIFHKHTMWVALSGLAAVLFLKTGFDSGFNFITHIVGTENQTGEWKTLLNLLGLLFGFAILAKTFEESRLPDILPKYLPDNWTGGLVLLALIMVISSFLDNIAAAILGGTIARVVFKDKIHIGYIAAIIAASNAGGAWSVVGDTTTTLMWIDGVHPGLLVKAVLASLAAFVIFGVIGARQQHRFQAITKDAPENVKVDWVRILLVVMLLAFTILTNYLFDFPALGVWIAILFSMIFRPVAWKEVPNALQGTVFLLSLVTMAGMMPVNELPAASWQSSLSLGFVSAVFDNIPLTKLCLEQGGYDWGILAYAVGFGGSMIWFGSSAGVALTNLFPEGKSVVKYIRGGWHIALAYIAGFMILLAVTGWNPVSYKNSKTEKNQSITETNINYGK